MLVTHIIINDPSELNFGIEDFPFGWQIADKGEVNGGFQVRALKLGSLIALPELTVASWVRVFSDEQNASQSYARERLTKSARFVLGDPRIGDESFVYFGDATYELDFRFVNALARVTMYSTYGGSLEGVQGWAKKLEAKINSVKRLGLAPTPTATPSPTLIPAPMPRPTATPATDPAAGLRLAFSSGRDGNPEIYTNSARGTDLRRLTYAEANDWAPAWSPDGKKIAFMSARDGGSHLYFMDADGSNQRPMFADSVSGRPPDWAPDGGTIAVDLPKDGRHTIFLISVDGSQARQLTSGAGEEWCPRWSPDGSRIAFLKDGELYVMNPDGSNQLRLTSRTSGDCPVWSPDSKRIAFVQDFDVHVVSSDGSGLVSAQQKPGPNWGPSWSPDGRRIAFTCSYLVCTMNSGGSDLRVVFKDGINPVWSPDANFIAVLCGNPTGICIIRPDGTTVAQLASNVGNPYYSWSPITSMHE